MSEGLESAWVCSNQTEKLQVRRFYVVGKERRVKGHLHSPYTEPFSQDPHAGRYSLY